MVEKRWVSRADVGADLVVLGDKMDRELSDTLLGRSSSSYKIRSSNISSKEMNGIQFGGWLLVILTSGCLQARSVSSIRILTGRGKPPKSFENSPNSWVADLSRMPMANSRHQGSQQLERGSLAERFKVAAT